MHFHVMNSASGSRRHSTAKYNAKYYKRLLCSYFVLLVFTLGAGLLAYWYADQRLIDETNQKSDKVFSEIAAIIDERIDSAQSYVNNVVRNEDVQSAAIEDYKDGKIPLIVRYNVHKCLKTLYHENFYDLVVYFRNSKYVLSGGRAASVIPIYSRSYALGISEDTLDHVIEQSYFPSVNDLNGKSLIAVAQTVQTGLPLRRLNAVAVCILRTDMIERLISDFTADNGMFWISNTSGNIVYRSDPLADECAHLASIDKDSIMLAGRQYLIKNHKGVSELDYGFAIPQNVYGASISAFRTYSLILFSVFFVLSVVMLVLITSHNYKPIRQLIDTAEQQSGESHQNSNDIEYLRKMLMSSTEEQRRFSVELQDRFVNRALLGLEHQDNDLFTEFRTYGLNLVSDSFMLIGIFIESPDSFIGTEDYLESLLNHDIDAALSNVISERCGVLLCYQPRKFLYLLNLKEDETQVVEAMRQFKAAFTANHAIEITIACSERRVGWPGLAESFSQVSRIFALRAIYGKGSFIQSGDIAQADFRYSFTAQSFAEVAILSWLNTGSPEPEAIIDQVIAACCAGSGLCLPEEFQCYANDMITLLKRLCRQTSMDEVMVEQLRECDNLPQYNKMLVELLEEMRAVYSESRRQETGRDEAQLCRQVITYIEQNISDPALCTDQIGEIFGITGPYLSKRFKQVSGLSISAQITEKRVEYAKKMLTGSGDSIETIAQALGFTDSSAFIRTFKKATNITPGTYRKLYKSEGDQT